MRAFVSLVLAALASAAADLGGIVMDCIRSNVIGQLQVSIASKMEYLRCS